MTWLARAIVQMYPSAWRGRYEAEVLDLLEAAPVRLRDLTELIQGLVLERWRQLATSPESPRRTIAVLVLFGPMVVMAVVFSAIALGQFLGASAGTWSPSAVWTGQVLLMIVVFGSLLERGARALQHHAVRRSGAVSVTLLGLFIVATMSSWGDLVRFEGIHHLVSGWVGTVSVGLFFWVMGIGATQGLWPDRTILDDIDRREVAEYQLRMSRAWVDGCHTSAASGLPVPLEDAEAQVSQWEAELREARAALEAMGYRARFQR